MREKIRALLVEHGRRDARLVRAMLGSFADADFDVVHVSRLSTAVQRLKLGGFDIVLLDLALPDGQGLGALSRVREAAPGVPVIVLINLEDAALGIRAVEAGAQDFLIKEQLDTNLLAQRSIRYGVARDKAEEMLRESEERYRILAEVGQDYVFIVGSDLRVQYVNRVAAGLLGRAPEELIGRHVEDLFSGETFKKQRLHIETVLFSGKPSSLEAELVLTDRAVWLDTQLVPLKVRTGEVAAVMGVARDVTERKRGEQLLRSRAEQQAMLADLGQYALTGPDLDDLMNRAVRLLAKVLEVEYATVLELLPGGEAFLLRARLDAPPGDGAVATVRAGRESQAGFTLLSNQPVIVEDFEQERRFTTPPSFKANRIKSGMSVIIRGQEQPFGVISVHTKKQRKFSSDEVLFLQSVANVLAQAIQRRKAGEALALSEARLRLVASQMPVILWTTDTELRVTGATGRGLERVGADVRVLEGKSLGEIFPLVAPSRSLADIHREALQGRSGSREVVVRGRHYEARVEPLRDLSGKIIGCLGVAMDITERKQAEQALRASEERYRTLAESATDYVFILSREGRLLYVNPAAASAFSTTAEKLVGKPISELFPVETLSRRMHSIARVFETGGPLRVGDWVPFPRGAAWLETSLVPLRNAAGQVEVVMGISRDITERKRAEEALRESEERLVRAHAELERRVAERTEELRAANEALEREIARRRRIEEELSISEHRYRALVEQIPAVVYLAKLDVASTTIYVSPQVLELIGYTPDEYRADPDIWRKRLHPDDRERVLSEVAQCHEHGTPFVSEYRMIRRNGQVVWFRDEARIIKGRDGEPLFLQGVMLDITDRKRAEEALAESEHRYKFLAESVPDVIWTTDLELHFTYVNAAVERVLGYSASKTIGMRAERLMTPSSFELLTQVLREELTAEREAAKPLNRSRTLELEMLRKDGTTARVETRISLLRDPSGQPYGLVGVSRDISGGKDGSHSTT